MKKPLIGACALTAATAIAVIIGLTASSPAPTGSPSSPTTPASVVRGNSHYLDEVPNAKVTVVEFLDFECEACALMYPYVESAREKYQGEINFVVRYFPIPAHRNSENAALAAEAASRQGKLEQMYQRLYATQKAWGEKQSPQAPLFRTLADGLGLNLTRYDSDVADTATLQRVLVDRAEGTALGVSSTPTFFINKQQLQLNNVNDLDTAIQKALDNARN